MSTQAPIPPAPETRARPSDPPGPARSMPAAKTPVGSGALAALGLILALLLTAAGVVLTRDALVYFTLLTGTPWTRSVARAVNGVTAAAWLVPLGIALALVGLWLLWRAVRPRARTAVSLTSATGVFLRPHDIARFAETAAESVSGVISADVNASRRSVTVQVRGTGSEDLADQVRAAVTERLSALDSPPAIKVTAGGPA